MSKIKISIGFLISFFKFCSIMGIATLCFWWTAISFFGDLTYKTHSKFFPISKDQFLNAHYLAFIVSKALISFLFIFPYMALKISNKPKN